MNKEDDFRAWQGPLEPTNDDLVPRNQSAPVRYSPAPPTNATTAADIFGGGQGLGRPPSHFGQYEPSARTRLPPGALNPGMGSYTTPLSRRQFGSTPLISSSAQLKSEQILRDSLAALQRLVAIIFAFHFCLSLYTYLPII